jgi:branched-chain amino acid transport system permease protein
MTKQRHIALVGVAAVVVALCALLPLAVGPYALGVGLSLLMWVALAESWAMFSGLSGYISLGHAVFYGVGAYATVLMWQAVPLWIAIPLSGLAAGLLAAALGWPCLRVRGPYFVILTLGVSEFVKYVVISSEAALGRNGRLLIGTPSLAVLYEAMLVIAVVSMIVLYVVRSSRLGAGLLAIREDEVAAEAVGINAAALKLLAFTLSALIPGVIGGLMILRSTYFEPLQAFNPTTSFTIVTIAILGGSDEVPGPLLGAILLVLMSELLWARASEVYMIILGVLLIAFVLFVPEGLLGRAQRLLRPAKP